MSSPKILFDLRSIGLGDSVCAEPVIRYAMERYYPDLKIWTDYPELYGHLGCVVPHTYNEVDRIVSASPHMVQDSKMVTHPMASYLQAGLIRSIDLISFMLLRQQLPMQHQTPRLVPDPVLIKNLHHQFPDLKNSWLIHPGHGDPLRSFGRDYWNGIAKEIGECFVIGKMFKRFDQNFGSYPLDYGVDVRNDWSLEGLIAACSIAKGIITNDSGPLHVMGAFDKWIVAIPTIRDAGYLFPTRANPHKNVAIQGEKLYAHEYQYAPHLPGPRVCGEIVTSFNPAVHLPAVEKVIQKIKEIDNE